MKIKIKKVSKIQVEFYFINKEEVTFLGYALMDGKDNNFYLFIDESIKGGWNSDTLIYLGNKLRKLNKNK